MAIINGTTGDDKFENTLFGTEESDEIFGLDGDDWFVGLAGDDTLDGGAGNGDRVFYGDSPAGINANLTTGVVSDGYGNTDTLIGIEQVFGTFNHDDTLTGGGGIDGLQLVGRGGNDVLVSDNGAFFADLDGGEGNDSLTSLSGDVFFEPGSGQDTVTGSSGFGIISYWFGADESDPPATSGVVVTFTGERDGTVLDFAGDTDTFTNIDSARGTANADSFIGTTGRQQFTGHQGNDTFDGGDGEDRVDYSRSNYVGASTGVSVNLATGTATDSFGDTDTLMNIEEIRGTEFADTIIGDDEDNRLEGRDGDDTLDGAGGDDTLRGHDGNDSLLGGEGRDNLSGGDGNDTLDGGDGDAFFEPGAGDDVIIGSGNPNDFNEIAYIYDARNAAPAMGIVAVFTSDGAGTVTDYAGNTDTFTGIDAIRGTQLDDSFTGSAGRETFTGLEGNDTFDGGDGIDRVEYRWAQFADGMAGVTVDLSTGTATDPFGDTDTLISIERIRGTDFADTIIGDAEDNFLEGRGGDDSLVGGDGRDELVGEAGDDTLDGGAGDEDEAGYRDAAAGVFANLTTGTASDGDGGTDTLVNIERIVGSDHDDTLIGDGNNNQLRGGEGDDSLSGLGGDDNLFGGQGSDTLEGGDGRDELRGGAGDDTLDGGAGDRDEARYNNNNNGSGITGNLTTGIVIDGWGNTDTLIGIEEIRGSNFDDVLIGGTGGVTRLRGEAGDDSLTGADDEFETGLNGNEGNDTLDGGTGGAFMSPGSGDDVIIGGTEAEGFYSVDYLWDARDEGASSGITVVYSAERDGSVTDFAGDTDSFTGIDRVQGTMFADSFTGTDGDQDFRGHGGDDFFDGGAGDGDRIDYSRPEAEFGTIGGVIVDMAAGTATDAYGDTDTFTNIERIRGTDFDDSIIGDNARNELDGRDGSDILNGGAGDDGIRGGDGDDTLLGGAGNDYLEGGSGADTFVVASGDGSVFIADFEIGVDTLDLTGFARADALAAINSAQAGSAILTFGDGTVLTIEGNNVTPETLSLDDIELADEVSDPGQTITGDDTSESLTGGTGDDTISGAGGDDTLTGQAGDDVLDGGDGVDTAVYSGDQASYTLTLAPGGTTLEDRRPDGNGTDSLTGIEFLDFDTDLFGTPFDLQQFGGPTGLSEEAFKSFIELYIAYFNRAPDAVGLNFWGTAFAGGTSLETMAALFEPQAETQAAYPPGTSNEVFATTVYNNVLGRIPDQDGLDFWVGVLNGGSVGRDTFILEVLRGVKADPPPGASQEFIDQQMADAQYLSDKTDIGAYFAVIKGMSDTGDAAAAMALFDGSEASIMTAVQAIDTFHAAALDPDTGSFLMPLVGVLDDPFV